MQRRSRIQGRNRANQSKSDRRIRSLNHQSSRFLPVWIGFSEPPLGFHPFEAQNDATKTSIQPAQNEAGPYHQTCSMHARANLVRLPLAPSTPPGLRRCRAVKIVSGNWLFVSLRCRDGTSLFFYTGPPGLGEQQAGPPGPPGPAGTAGPTLGTRTAASLMMQAMLPVCPVLDGSRRLVHYMIHCPHPDVPVGDEKSDRYDDASASLSLGLSSPTTARKVSSCTLFLRLVSSLPPALRPPPPPRLRTSLRFSDPLRSSDPVGLLVPSEGVGGRSAFRLAAQSGAQHPLRVFRASKKTPRAW